MDSGLCLEAVWGLFQQNWLPRAMLVLPQLAPCPAGWKSPSPEQYGLCNVAMPWLPFTRESLGLTQQWRKACAKRPGCALRQSMPGCASSNEAQQWQLRPYTTSDVYLVKEIWALSHAREGHSTTSAYCQQTHTPSATADLQGSNTMLMRNPRPLLYLAVLGDSHSLVVLQLFGEGRDV